MRRDWFDNPDSARLLTSSHWSECEDRIYAFENAWRQGPPPAIADFLCASGSIRRALLVELVHVDLEFRLKRGEAVQVQSYLEGFSELRDDRSAALELIAAEYELRRRMGGDVSLDEYRVRFPSYIDDLVERLRGAKTELSASTRIIRGRWPRPAVPGYEIEAGIGRGGMGVVYKARELSLGRHVALKFLPIEFSRDPDRLDRFLREARTASSLNHPHICVVHALEK